MRKHILTDDYAGGVLAGDRAILAQAITLIESRKGTHQAQAQELLQQLQPHAGNAHRIGITGVPGVGKSTTIEKFGSSLTAAGHRIAVLALDPTSSLSGGAILGDKTRMAQLAADPNAFIRPSPTAGNLGGVARKTRETMTLCEAAGFDVILVETVGVGQSEITVSEMVDFLLFLALPGAGDELQGIKKGVLEIADMIAVNKADGNNLANATRAAAEYRAALHILQPQSPNWSPPVITISGLHGDGLDVMWQQICGHRAAMEACGEFAARRCDQAVRWMRRMLEDRLLHVLVTDARVVTRLPQLEAEVRDGRITPVLAVDELLSLTGLAG